MLFSVLENGCCRKERQQYAIERAGEGMVKQGMSKCVVDTYIAKIKYKEELNIHSCYNMLKCCLVLKHRKK